MDSPGGVLVCVLSDNEESDQTCHTEPVMQEVIEHHFGRRLDLFFCKDIDDFIAIPE